jgi:hypothetical protein
MEVAVLVGFVLILVLLVIASLLWKVTTHRSRYRDLVSVLSASI